jgi:segregation and condensation protein A
VGHECQVKLEVFEGPLDLLLHLIRKNKLEITDIPIALVTAQYLEYLEFMQVLDIVLAGDYLVMAATLMHIKSGMLLPRPDPPDPEDDPRLEIVRPLQELMRIREASEALAERALLGRDVFVREEGLDEETDPSTPGAGPLSDEPLQVSISQLISAFKSVLGNSALPRILEISRARMSLSACIESLTATLLRTGRTRFFELFSGEDRGVIVVTFLALLELARLGWVRLVQEEPHGDILILSKRKLPPAAVMAPNFDSIEFSPAPDSQ